MSEIPLLTSTSSFFRNSSLEHVEEIAWQECSAADIEDLVASARFDIDFVGIRGSAHAIATNRSISYLLGQCHGTMFTACSLKIARFQHFKRCLVFAKIGKNILLQS